jgi:5-methylcytosine-specific restriction enzyme A
MTYKREPRDRGWKEGRRVGCRWCGGPLEGARNFCGGRRSVYVVKLVDGKKKLVADPRGHGCAHEWALRSDSVYRRAEVMDRDRGVCAICGLDTADLYQQTYDLLYRVHAETEAAEALLDKHRIPYRTPLPENWKRIRWWEADHIVPVCEGGGECGLEGIRTLCVACHRDESNALTRRRAARRREIIRLRSR